MGNKYVIIILNSMFFAFYLFWLGINIKCFYYKAKLSGGKITFIVSRIPSSIYLYILILFIQIKNSMWRTFDSFLEINSLQISNIHIIIIVSLSILNIFSYDAMETSGSIIRYKYYPENEIRYYIKKNSLYVFKIKGGEYIQIKHTFLFGRRLEEVRAFLKENYTEKTEQSPEPEKDSTENVE